MNTDGAIVGMISQKISGETSFADLHTKEILMTPWSVSYNISEKFYLKWVRKNSGHY